MEPARTNEERERARGLARRQVSHTIIHDIRAVALVDSGSGQIGYALFERSCDSNTHPRRPGWQCAGFGTAEDCIQTILGWAGMCPGGMLRGPRRGCTAHEFLARWRKALAAPVGTAQTRLDGRFGQHWGDVSVQSREPLLPLIAACGEHLDGARFRIDLDRPGAVGGLAAITKGGWHPVLKRLDFSQTLTQPNKGLGVKAQQRVHASLDGVRVYVECDPRSPAFERNHVTVIDGVGRPTGWWYSTVEDFVREVVKGREAACPGAADDLLERFERLRLQTLASLPDDAIVFIEPTAADEHGSLRLEWCEAARAACAPGLDWPVRASAKVLRDAGLLFDLVSGGMPVTVRIEQRSGEAAGAAAAKCGAEQPMLL